MADQQGVIYPDQVREQLAGKTILVIGPSRDVQRLMQDVSVITGVKILMVEHKTYGQDQTDNFIRYDYFTDKNNLRNHASNIITLLGDRVSDIRGCITFTEEVTQLTAVLCEKLNLRGNHPDAPIVALSKHKTNEALKSSTNNTIFKTESYSSQCYRIHKEEDLIEMAGLITYPAILKPEFYACSWGVVKVMSQEDCLLHYRRIQNLFKTSEFGTAFEKTLILMEFLEGLSYEVDVVVYDGELLAAIIADIGLYLPRKFGCTTVCTPSNLSAKLRNQLETAAHHCCGKLGLLNGVFNTEFKLTKDGFKLIEINVRVGSFFRCEAYEKTHGVNLLEITSAIACGIKPHFPDLSTRCFAVGAFLYPDFQGKQFLKKGVEEKLKALGETKDILLAVRRDRINIHPEDEEFFIPFCHLVALNNTSIKCARQKLIQLFKDFDFTGTVYDIEHFTSIWA